MRFKLVSMAIGIRNGMIFVARTSRGIPPAFVDDIATLIMPNIAMSTAGSRDGIDCRSGRTSSIIIHLSNDSTNLPKQIKQFTRTLIKRKHKRNILGSHHSLTLNVIVSKQIFFIRGRIQYFIAC